MAISIEIRYSCYACTQSFGTNGSILGLLKVYFDRTLEHSSVQLQLPMNLENRPISAAPPLAHFGEMKSDARSK